MQQGLKRSRLGMVLASIVVLSAALVTAAEPELPSIVILATGGTIAGAGASETDAGYESGKLSVEVLIEAVPALATVARVRGEQIANVGSQDMSDAIWLKLAARVNQLLADDEVDGVVITHGTDTMEETAYLLHLVVASAKPVVLTGAMRPATALSADGPLNLLAAVSVAADPQAHGRGALVVLNDDIHSARAVTKASTTDVQTFTSPERGLIGVVQPGRNLFFRTPYTRHTTSSQLRIDGVEQLPRVDIVYAHAGMPADLISAAVAAGARGIVVAGVGNGNLSRAALQALAEAAKKGVVCVRSTRVSYGVVGRNVETDDDTLGFVAAHELNPPKARILLKLALLKTSDPAKIQQLFWEY